MNMSLMVVQPLLDAGKHVLSQGGGKHQGGDTSNPFQALLQGQMAARQPEKQIFSSSAENKQEVKQPSVLAASEGTATAQAKAPESVKEGEAQASEKTEETAVTEVDATVLAQMMAAAAGAQMVPLEPVPGNDALELADDAGRLLLATDVDADADKRMLAAAEPDFVEGEEVGAEAGEASVYKKVQADVDQHVKTAPGKPVVDSAATKTTTAQTLGAKPMIEQPVAQVQPVATMQAQQVQQAPLAPMANQADPAFSRIMQQMGSPQWNQAIGQRVLWMVGQEQQSASLTLNPPELGPVRVVVNVSNNHASANFFSAHPDVRQALEGSLPRLREMMEGAGIQLGQAQVGAENSDNPQSGQASQSSSGRTAAISGNGAESAGVAKIASASTSVKTLSRGLVDTFA